MNYSELCKDVRSIVFETAEYIKSEQVNKSGISIESKGRHNFVTHVDMNAERMLVKKLSDLIPESGFIAEEGTLDKKGDKYNWVIDPIDGTTNYIHGLPPFAVSVALMEDRQIVVGVIYEIGLQECFYAWKDSPAFLNDTEIHVTDTFKVSESLIATGFPYTNYKYLDGFIQSIRYFMKNSHGLRRLGSAATDIAYTACGRFDGFYEYGLQPWDVAAGSLILKQAGGKVGNFDGNPDCLFGEEFIASNSSIFDEFQQIIRKLIRE
ncbi:MAG: inositol monophosphatase family protein [Bacteroidota bacterium]